MRILYNAKVMTQDSKNPQATAIAIDQGRIVATGSDFELLQLRSSFNKAEDMRGRTIWPGLIDAHLHLSWYATSLQTVNAETETQQECIRRVGERALNTPAGQWVIGHGWNQNVWPEGFGTAAQLDAVTPLNPVYLTAKSVHAAWANSLALQRAGIDRSTPDPDGGKIGRDAAGNPDGILYENAMLLVQNIVPESSSADMARQLEHAQQTLWSMGLTGVHDFDGAACFNGLQILQEQQKLKLRVLKGIRLNQLEQALEMGLRPGFGNDMLRLGQIKLFADGALGPCTAAMFSPYEGETAETGLLLLDREQIYEIGLKAQRNGFGLATHAIGDRANHEVLAAYHLLRERERSLHLPQAHYRIEHVQVLHPDDYSALAADHIVASMQPIHATSDMDIADLHWGKRSAGAYAWHTLLERNTLLAFGSDAPVESPNPFLGLHAAVTRQRPNGYPGPNGWYPEQRLTLQQALAGFTLGPAFAAGMSHQQGRIAPGYLADLIVLDQDPFTLPPETLHTITPLSTMVGGEWVWAADRS